MVRLWTPILCSTAVDEAAESGSSATDRRNPRAEWGRPPLGGQRGPSTRHAPGGRSWCAALNPKGALASILALGRPFSKLRVGPFFTGFRQVTSEDSQRPRIYLRPNRLASTVKAWGRSLDAGSVAAESAFRCADRRVPGRNRREQPTPSRHRGGAESCSGGQRCPAAAPRSTTSTIAPCPRHGDGTSRGGAIGS